jgi:flagellar biosynthesis regulator FlbT
MGDRPQWRVSSTLFTMFRNDARVDPLKEIEHLHENGKVYETPFTAHQLLMRELDAIGLSVATSVAIGEAKVNGDAASP